MLSLAPGLIPDVGAALLPERENKYACKCQTCHYILQVSMETAGSAPPDLQIQVGVITNRIKIARFPDNEI